MSTLKFNHHSFASRAGQVSGYIMGRAISDPVSAISAFGALAKDSVQQFLLKGPEAVKVKTQVVKRKETIAYARDAQELAAESQIRKGSALTSFRDAIKGGYAAGKKAGQEAKLKRSAPKPALAPG